MPQRRGSATLEHMEAQHVLIHHQATRRHLSNYSPVSAQHEAELLSALRDASIFQHCSDDKLKKVVKHMRRLEFKAGEVLLEQGEPQDRVYLITEGSVARLRCVCVQQQCCSVAVLDTANHAQ
jgi:hypothetical protein